MDVALLLKNEGLRVTKIRVELLTALNQEGAALSQSDLQLRLASFDRTSLYRNLGLLIDHGLIHKALEENGTSFYAACSGCDAVVHRHDHVHVKCTECDRVECRDLPVELAQRLQGLALAELNISAKGLCTFCAA